MALKHILCDPDAIPPNEMAHPSRICLHKAVFVCADRHAAKLPGPKTLAAVLVDLHSSNAYRIGQNGRHEDGHCMANMHDSKCHLLVSSNE